MQRSLTELIHQRGINCRYLGRLATLARIEELEDINSFEKAAAAAASNANDELSIIPPRLRMPICWLELLECEMVARAAKHVLDSYMIEESSAQPARMIASFLSAIISVGEESAGETEHRQAHSGSKVIPDQDEMNALTLCFEVCDEVNGYSTPSPLFKGRGEIWSDIEREIGRRYRYTLSLFNTKNSAKRGATSRALYIPLLRRICQRSGIRLVSRKYDVGKNCVTGPTVTYPIAPTDVLEILPLVKHAASVSGESFAPCSFNSAAGSSLHVLLPDAKTRYEVAHESYFTNRNATLALNYAQEASAMVRNDYFFVRSKKCCARPYFHQEKKGQITR
jgi:protein TIF31